MYKRDTIYFLELFNVNRPIITIDDVIQLVCPLEDLDPGKEQRMDEGSYFQTSFRTILALGRECRKTECGGKSEGFSQ